MNVFDIARLAGVSRKTVQRVLTDAANVKPETREKIRRIMDEHHFEPSDVARKLSARRTRTIGIFIVQDSRSYELHADDLFFGAVIGGIVNQCGYMDYKTLISIVDIASDDKLLRFYKEKSIDAGIIVSWSRLQPIVDKVTGAGFRIAVFDQNNVDRRDERIIVPQLDNRAGGRAAATYLLRLGHRDLGIVTGDLANPSAAERLDGFRDALREFGLEAAPERIVPGNFTERAGADAVDRWLAAGGLPEAICCANDLTAYGVLDRLASHGLAAPRNVSVVGFDDLLVSRYTQPALTTMRIPRVAMAEAMTERLIRQLENGLPDEEPQPLQFEAELVVRQSCMTRERS